MVKLCTKCGETKPVTAFFKRGDRSGYRAHCRSCLKRDDGQRARRRALRAASPERAILAGMVQRCHNPKNPGFPNYGGRGIVVCEIWRNSFEAFLADMGPRPTPKHTIERKKNDGPYEPGNCRWATRAEQNRNTRQNVNITIDGVTRCRAEWAALPGAAPAKTIRDRMEKLGWDATEAVFTPVRKCRRAA